jgi:hypothetical protein
MYPKKFWPKRSFVKSIPGSPCDCTSARSCKFALKERSTIAATLGLFPGVHFSWKVMKGSFIGFLHNKDLSLIPIPTKAKLT